MSGSTIGGVVGGVIGFWVGGPQGAQIGWMIGSAVGGYVDPEQISQFGPRLTDAAQQTAQDGIPIPYGYGTFPTRGNIIWCGPIVEHVNESTDDGKGSGQEVTTTTYTYTRSYAIGICQGEIAGLLIVKRNGKIVYDARTDAELTALGYTSAQITEARATAAKSSLRFVFYTGSETQTADPTIEAHEGVGEVPGFRGLAYMVVTDDDVTELRGAVPQYEFVVRASGTASETCAEELLVAHWPLNDAARNGVAEEVIGGWNGVYSDTAGVGVGPELVAGGGPSFYMETINDYMVYTYDDDPGYPGVRSGDGWTVTVWARPTNTSAGSVVKNIATYWQAVVEGSREWGFQLDGTDNMVPQGSLYDEGGVVVAIDAASAAGAGNTLFLALRWEADSPGSASGTLTFFVNGASVGSTAADKPSGQGEWMAVGGYGIPASYGFIGYVQAVKQYSTALTDAEIADRYRPASAYTEVPDAPGTYVGRDGQLYGTGCYSTVTAGSVLLSDIVAAEFQRVGLTSDDYDVSQLTDEVLGYRVLPNGSGVDAALGPLMQAYFFDVAEWDGKLRCIKRGGASSLSLTMDDLAERDGEAIEWTRVQEAELLRVQTIAYVDPVAGYTPTTQKWERRAGTVQAKGEAAVEVPITATADTAAGIAKKRGLIAWAETEKAKISLPYRRAKITPTDVLTLVDDNGDSHRLRVGQIEDDSGVRLLEVTKERGNVYSATATGQSPNNPSVPDAGLVGPTKLVAMNLPRLRTTDEESGAYVAVTGLLPGWKGADIYVSADGGVTYQFAKRVLSRATMGVLAESCTSSSEPITVTLYDGRSLSSITADQLAARQNGFAITSAGVSEIGQFQTATENVDDDWELTDVSRGEIGTIATAHSAGDPFVLLDTSVPFMPLDASLGGTTLLLRAVSLGTSFDDNPSISFYFDPQVIVLDGNGDEEADDEGEDPSDGGTGGSSSGLPTLTIGATVIDVTDAPYSAVGDGVTDDSAAFEAAMAALEAGGGGTLEVPAGTYLIDPTYQDGTVDDNSRCGIKMRSGTRLRLLTGATIKGKVTNDDYRHIVYAYEIDNFEIVGGTIEGYLGNASWTVPASGAAMADRKEHQHNIAIFGCTDWIVRNLTSKKATADGIGIGRRFSSIVPEDGYIFDCIVTQCRRQGITVGRSNNITVKGCQISYIGTQNGTAPMAGIDVEPDNPTTQQSTNTTITDCTITDCRGPAVLAYRSANSVTVEGCTMERCNRGIYAYHADNGIARDNIIRYMHNSGVYLSGTSTGWAIGGAGDENEFFSNKTATYGTFTSGSTTTVTGTSSVTARHIVIASTATGNTIGANEYGPV